MIRMFQALYELYIRLKRNFQFPIALSHLSNATLTFHQIQFDGIEMTEPIFSGIFDAKNSAQCLSN